MAAFVLHLGQQDGLALERGRARDPVPFGQHADDFTVCVLADLPHQGPAVVGGHPILGLDEFARVDAGVETSLALRLFGAGGGLRRGRFARHRVHGLGVHAPAPVPTSKPTLSTDRLVMCQATRAGEHVAAMARAFTGLCGPPAKIRP
jgi:hypothetical protein